MDEKSFEETYSLGDQLFLQISAAAHSGDTDAAGLPAAAPITADDYISNYRGNFTGVFCKISSFFVLQGKKKLAQQMYDRGNIICE